MIRKNAQQADWIQPDWPAPNNIRAISTTRQGGCSRPPFDHLNFGLHVGDDSDNVMHNRQQISESLRLPNEPLWLAQVHGTEVASMNVDNYPPTADASIALKPHQICVVMTADCLPVLFCDRQGTCVAAAHAGWRGLYAGILEETVQKLNCSAEDLLAWLGPAIGPSAFEVGDEVRDLFIAHDEQAATAFKPNQAKDAWLADIYQLARQRLQAVGVAAGAIYGGEYCTFSDPARFFSYRRDGQTGRMGSFIWIASC